MASAYRGLWSSVRTYWSDYGGVRAFIASPFFHFSLLIAALGAAGFVRIDWRVVALGALPTVLGFSLAAYAITFTLMGSKLHAALVKAFRPNSNRSLFLDVNATFFHILFVQAIALSFALVTKGDLFWRLLGGKPGYDSFCGFLLWLIVNGTEFLGMFLIVYAMTLLFSVAIAMFRLGRLSNRNTPATSSVLPPPIPQSPVDISKKSETLKERIVRSFRVIQGKS